MNSGPSRRFVTPPGVLFFLDLTGEQNTESPRDAQTLAIREVSRAVSLIHYTRHQRKT
jgi:hypothetical protein